MRIRSRTDTTMLLSGVPGGIGWMCFSTLFGVLLSVAFGWVATTEYRASGVNFPVVMCSLGVLLGQLFLCTGLVTLAIGRESLMLDRSAKVGRYHARSPIVTVPKPFEFTFDRIHAVSIERYTERRPGGRGGRGGGMSEMDVCRARLLIDKPRRAVTLDETRNHRDARVEAVARSVADFLSVPIEQSDRRKDR